MRTKNLTPFPLGTRVTSTRPPEPELVLVVRGRFRLVPGGVATPVEKSLPLPASDLAGMREGLEVLAQGPLQAETFAPDDAERTGAPTYPGDFADWKPRGEAMLIGAAYAPERRPAPSCEVGFRVGSLEKRLVVFGARGWDTGLLGGATATEPVPFTRLVLGYERAFGGKGSEQNPAGIGLDGRLLPNVEYPNARVTSPSDRPKPAGFGPIASTWSFRKRKLGTAYGASYAARAPFYAEDFDWHHFQSAPRDQWLEGYFRGDEPVVLENLHREHARLETRLPGLRIRAFVHDHLGNFREAPMVLDTVLLDPEKDELLLTWRGRTPVLDLELDDVTTVLVGSEPLEGPSRPLDAWRDDLLRFEADPLGLDDLPPEFAQVMRAKTDAERARAALAFLESQAPGATAKLDEALAKSPEGGTLEATLVRGIPAANDAPPPIVSPGQVSVHLGVRDALADAHTRLVADAPAQVEEFEATLEKLDLRRLDPTFRTPRELPRGEATFGPGANLDGRDLSGLDLTGVNLEGASLRGVIAKGTRFAGANLTNADLEGALLFKATLDGASLRGARLVLTNAARARLDGATLDGARLDHTHLGGASLVDARLDGVTGSHTMFDGAALIRTSFARARLERADFSEVRFEGTSFVGALLEGVLFYEAKLDGVRFDGARLDGVSFDRSQLDGATFVGASGSRTVFSEAGLAQADFRWSRFVGAHFTKCHAEGARFDDADLTGARFFKANLTGATFCGAKLVGIDLGKTRLDGARFDGAMFYDAKLLGAKGQDTSFRDVLLAHTARHA